jgi:hypothetical protein
MRALGSAVARVVRRGGKREWARRHYEGGVSSGLGGAVRREIVGAVAAARVVVKQDEWAAALGDVAAALASTRRGEGELGRAARVTRSMRGGLATRPDGLARGQGRVSWATWSSRAKLAHGMGREERECELGRGGWLGWATSGGGEPGGLAGKEGTGPQGAGQAELGWAEGARERGKEICLIHKGAHGANSCGTCYIEET